MKIVTRAIAYWRSAWGTIVDLRRWIGAAGVLFAASFAVRFCWPGLLAGVWQRRQNSPLPTPGSPWAWETTKTFFHNAVLDYVFSRLGRLWGQPTGIFVVVNGLATGMIIPHVVAPDRWKTAALLAPHAIFELSAMFISIGLGFALGMRPGSPEERRSLLSRSHTVFFAVCIPLSLIAAMIEEWRFIDWKPRIQ